MEVGAANGADLSYLKRQKLCLVLAYYKRVKCFGTLLWKFLFLGLILVSCSSLLFASFSSQSLDCTTGSAIAVLGIRSLAGVHTDEAATKRRHLFSPEGDYETLPLFEKDDYENKEAAAVGYLVKEAEKQALSEKVANGDEDYENVALTAGEGAEGQVQLQNGREDPQQKVEEDEEEPMDTTKSGHRGVEKLLDRLEESVGNEEDGRFNKTISEQEGVLETVARVGGRSFDDEEDEEEPTEEEKEVIRQIGEEFFAGRPKDEAINNGDAGRSENSKGVGNTDVTWLDRIMGQSEQPHTVMKENAGKIPLMVSQRKNFTREKFWEDNNVGYHQVEDVPRLIDREDNEYVISNPGKNRMMLQEDLTLISDIVMVIAAASLGGTVCGLLGQPVILGYLAAGMMVGPGGLHLVHELVQVETLAQFGVVFLLFVLGVEFNPSKMQGIHNVTLGGGCLQIGTAMLLGGLLGSSVPQGVFIGAFLSMSSTAVVVKCLMDSKMGGTEHGQIMLGTLILQDCALGLLLAVMPALAAQGSDLGTFILALSRAAVLLLLFCGSAWVFGKFFIPRFLHTLVQLTRFNSELFLLGAIGVCLSLALLSQSMGLSLEVGAFVGGLVLSGGIHTEKTLHQVEPIRNVFAALFLASIGMVMHPVFLWEHIDILMASLGVVFLGKTFLLAVVVRSFGYNKKTSVSVGIALAQIGEFAFILLSRAQGLGLVSKKLYLLLMGTSALSLVLTPFAFKVVIRLNPPGQPAFKSPTSTPSHSHCILVRQDVSQGFLSTPEPQEDAAPSYWSLPMADVSSDNCKGSESVHTRLWAELKQQDQSRDLEELSKSDRQSSPLRVILRRPNHQVLLNSKGNEWKDELEESEVYDKVSKI